MQLPVVIDASRVEPVQTDLGYLVTMTRARAAIRDIEFSIEGEEHEISALAHVWNWLVPSAYAHPGHSAGGEVTGELRGSFIIDWMDAEEALGTASLLTGAYHGANFVFRHAGAEDGLSEDDPLLGHTFAVGLEVSRGEESWQVDVVLDLDEDTALIGVPFDHEVTKSSSESIGLELATKDPFQAGTLFDGIDFAVLDTGSDGVTRIAPGQTAHNQLRRLFGSHDFYFIETH